MCATYVIKAHRDLLRKRYGLELPENFEGIDERIVPFKTAPVIVAAQGQLHIKQMQFSLIPNWSKERKPKFATFNARIEEIETKATWKDSFKRFHCVVPITNFIEPIYLGEHAGHMVSFDSLEILSAAGIYNVWIDRATGEEVPSYAIIMTEALPFVGQIGHARSPYFINGEAVNDWLSMADKDPANIKSFLSQVRALPSLTVSRDRPMAAGWQKRIPHDS